MQIDCYISEHCGSFHALKEHISQAIAETAVHAEVKFHTVTYDEAVALDVKGSPTIRINGKDIAEGGSPGIT